MRALTLHRPWPWAIAWGGKRIENRSWYPKFLAGETQWDGFVPALPGTRIAIHAGLSWNWDAVLFIRDTSVRAASGNLIWDRRDQTGIVAVVELIGFAPSGHPKASGPWYITGTAWAWILGEVTPLREPIPCKGRQRLWRLNAETERAVRRQLR